MSNNHKGPQGAIEERTKRLGSTLQAAYSNVVKSPLPADMMDLLRAMEDSPKKSRGSGFLGRRNRAS